MEVTKWLKPSDSGSHLGDRRECIRMLCMKACYGSAAHIVNGHLPEGRIEVQADERPIRLPRPRFQLRDMDSHELCGNFLEKRSLGSSFQLFGTCIAPCCGFSQDAKRFFASSVDGSKGCPVCRW